MAAATQGCASCSNAARPAARNSADSRLTFQLTESGPKMPCAAPAAERFTSSSRRSSSAAETMWESRAAICLYGIASGVAGERLSRGLSTDAHGYDCCSGFIPGDFLPLAVAKRVTISRV